jgi:hypothetical protein
VYVFVLAVLLEALQVEPLPLALDTQGPGKLMSEARHGMHIEFKMEGGLAHFPGLSKPVTIDSGRIPAEEATELENLVRAARFFDQPAHSKIPLPGAADYRRYTITVEADGRRHTVELTDPITDPDLQRLVTFLRAKQLQ